MSGYPQRIAENMLPYSRSQDLATAFSEWRFTGEEVDHEIPCEICQLCDHVDLRYHFLIANELTHHEMWVGSECIKKFEGIGVFDGNRRLTGAARDQYMASRVNNLKKATRKRKTMEALHQFAASNPRMASLPAFYDQNEVFTPRQAVMVLKCCERDNIEVDRAAIKIRLRRDSDNEQVLRMSDEAYALLRPCLSSSQRKRMDERRARTAPTRQARQEEWAELIHMGELLAAQDRQRGAVVASIINGLKSGRGLTAKQASLLLWRWKETFRNSDVLRHLRVTRQWTLPRVDDLEEWRLRQLLPCLSQQQLTQLKIWRPELFS